MTVWGYIPEAAFLTKCVPVTYIHTFPPKMQQYSLINLPKTRARGSKTWSFYIEKRLMSADVLCSFDTISIISYWKGLDGYLQKPAVHIGSNGDVDDPSIYIERDIFQKPLCRSKLFQLLHFRQFLKWNNCSLYKHCILFILLISISLTTRICSSNLYCVPWHTERRLCMCATQKNYYVWLEYALSGRNCSLNTEIVLF